MTSKERAKGRLSAAICLWAPLCFAVRRKDRVCAFSVMTKHLANDGRPPLIGLRRAKHTHPPALMRKGRNEFAQLEFLTHPQQIFSGAAKGGVMAAGRHFMRPDSKVTCPFESRPP